MPSAALLGLGAGLLPPSLLLPVGDDDRGEREREREICEALTSTSPFLFEIALTVISSL